MELKSCVIHLEISLNELESCLIDLEISLTELLIEGPLLVFAIRNIFALLDKTFFSEIIGVYSTDDLTNRKKVRRKEFPAIGIINV
jgi:hypothetical protein